MRWARRTLAYTAAIANAHHLLVLTLRYAAARHAARQPACDIAHLLADLERT
ncbi:MAG: hypothetical protein LC685_04415 [Actinobacteria bacterium]|nr:hypothetical protein [Actinomycetota bacterium]